jgi:hypothetical protein
MGSARWLAAVALLAAACQTFDPKHPLVGKPTDFAPGPAIYVWIENELWHVRFQGKGVHRFQGSVAGLRSGGLALTLTRPDLKNAVALAGDAVQFDLESPAAETIEARDGFDVRIGGDCARFDLYIDGHHHPDKVRMGPRAQHPVKMPFDRCR